MLRAADPPSASPWQRSPRLARQPASERKTEEPKKDKDAAPGKEKEPKDELSETTNTVSIKKALKSNIEATAGTIVIKDEEGKAHVSFFFIAYTSLDHTEV